MYVTRPRSLYRKFPGSVSVMPQQDEALHSGHLVISDEESESMDSYCCGIWKNDRIKRLPFPQDRILQVVHSSLHEEASVTKVWFVPVLDQPLSSNRYYVIKAKGRRKGQAYTCVKEGEMELCCFGNLRTDPKTRPFDHRDRYQQFEIRHYHNGGYFARSVEWDGHPPNFLKKGGWEVQVARSPKLDLREAQGLHESTSLDAPTLDAPLYSKRSTPITIGRWYCPFVFMREENCRVDEQMRHSMFYELSLKQWWEQIYSCKKENDQDNVVEVNAKVKRLLCLVHGMEAEKDDRHDADGFVWFKVKEHFRKRMNVGLSSALFEKMKWIKETRGWFDGEKEVRVTGTREVGSDNNGWRKFGCYVFVESFVLRRMDGNLLINFNFKNPHKIACRWE